MKKNILSIGFIVLFILASLISNAQDTLPNFSVRDIGKNKIQISWFNPFEQNCIQLAVQRSFDSSRFFKTIYSAQSPELPQNGFLDNKMPQNIKVYYRIFYVMADGKYFFTASKSLGGYTSTVLPSIVEIPENSKEMINIYINNMHNLYVQLDYPGYRNFRDSIIRETKDSLQVLTSTAVLLKPFIGKLAWRPSRFVFTNTNGYVSIVLPAVKQHKYKLIFYDDDGSILFEIKQIKESPLTLDKTNFIHSGWFSFELFEDDKVKERNKFFLGKEF
ncbi:hypothetical protein ACI6Q2_15805 [Chitinophagaceae bacterium LWZ2-11]